MDENWMAFMVAIVADTSVQEAFDRVSGVYFRQPKEPAKTLRSWSVTDKMIMNRMRENGMEWKAIGAKYGISGEHARAVVMGRRKSENQTR